MKIVISSRAFLHYIYMVKGGGLMASAWWQCPKCGRYVLTRGIYYMIIVKRKCPQCGTKVMITYRYVQKIEYRAEVTNVEVV